MPLLCVRVSEADATTDLRRHLARQGFPSDVRSIDKLSVLFPGSASIFEDAVELDLWRIDHPTVAVTIVDGTEDCSAARAAR